MDNTYIIEAISTLGVTVKNTKTDLAEALAQREWYFHKANVGGTVSFRIYHNGLFIDETVTNITTFNTKG